MTEASQLRDYQHTVDDVLEKTTGRWWWVTNGNTEHLSALLLRDAGWTQSGHSRWYSEDGRAVITILRIGVDCSEDLVGSNCDGWCGVTPPSEMGADMLSRLVRRATPVAR